MIPSDIDEAENHADDFQNAENIAEEALAAFARLYPKISLPYDVWDTLREMIARQAYGVMSGSGITASDILDVDLYIAAAKASGLR